ncbi:glycosyltransferase family 4 protein [Gelidibacter maritimus]|uniref:Glycosyltransferase family 4 protein n=1 Tax=Gelidibacter maritimus TaxID=2761487 RepID=A0A7W2M662_9FLAO|nr:glycosyltransferase family 4 protein [Gelidibacter maritimus]MBA6153392.1 glycosyltransferase family 4 protein [Gelidibacter maritimus]
MKILYIATSDIHLATFHKPYIKWLSEEGVQVDIAVENRGKLIIENIHVAYYLDFPRSLFNKKLFRSYRKLKRIIDEGEYDVVHCHTPIPSMLTRLAAIKARTKGTKVLYTAHGFHFYKGGPISRWLLYYPSEFILSYYTDAIITINQEDYNYVNNKMLHNASYYIKGIGVNSSRFRPLTESEKKKKRFELGISHDSFVLLYVAEFIPRKNHEFIIRALPKLIKTIPNIKIVFAGKGISLERMKSLAKTLGVSTYIDFLGFRNDVPELSGIADIGVSSSKHEGLGLGLAEEMMCGLPIVASYDRGHKEMIIHGRTGYMFSQGNTDEFISYIRLLYTDDKLRNELGANALEKSMEFRIENSLKSMTNIYKIYLNV